MVNTTALESGINNNKNFLNIFSKKVVLPLLFVIIVGASVGIVLSLLPSAGKSASSSGESTYIASNSPIYDVNFSFNTTGKQINVTIMSSLRCTIYKYSTESSTETLLSGILLTSWTEKNGTIFFVLPSDPLNGATNCNATTNGLRLLAYNRYLSIVPLDPVSVNISASLKTSTNISQVLANIKQTVPFHVVTETTGIPIVSPSTSHLPIHSISPSPSMNPLVVNSASPSSSSSANPFQLLYLGTVNSRSSFTYWPNRNLYFFQGKTNLHGVEIWCTNAKNKSI